MATALGWGFFLPLAYVLGVALEGGLTGAWIGSLICVCALLLVRRFRSGAWKRISIFEKYSFGLDGWRRIRRGVGRGR